MIAITSGLSTLLVIAAAIVLFARVRSGPAGLFLFGTLLSPLLPFAAVYLGFGRSTISYMALFVAIGPICAGIGLLWHALTTPKPAATANVT